MPLTIPQLDYPPGFMGLDEHGHPFWMDDCERLARVTAVLLGLVGSRAEGCLPPTLGPQVCDYIEENLLPEGQKLTDEQRARVYVAFEITGKPGEFTAVVSDARR
jgi:hypothetical protein